MGRAIVRQPKVFLFDEPLSNLDAKTRVSTRKEISKLHSSLNATMIYVTHDQTEAMTMGDRICVMHEGEIMQTAQPLDLYNKPANLFVAGFIGNPPMNFVKGRIERKEGKLQFLEISDSENAIHVELDPALAHQAEPFVGKDLILGIRPENIQLSMDKSQVEKPVELDIEMVEPLGNETLLHLTNGTTSLTARATNDSPFKAGQRTKVSFDQKNVHLFDPITEASLASI